MRRYFVDQALQLDLIKLMAQAILRNRCKNSPLMPSRS